MSGQLPFSQTPAEPTEMERIQKRIQEYRIQLTPAVAQAVQALLVSYLKSDQVTIDDLEVMVNIRKEVTSGLEEYKKSVESAQKRLTELQQQEVAAKHQELTKRNELEKTKLNEEKVRRKNLEDRVKKLEEEKNFLEKRAKVAQKQQIEQNQQARTTEDVMPKTTTRAFEEAKSKRAEKKGGSKPPVPTKQKLPEPKEHVVQDMSKEVPPMTFMPPEVKQEQDYEEITIPSRNELERMTKSDIEKESKKLNFKVSIDDTKKVMIESFEKQTEQLIEKLQSTGEFVSAVTDGDDETNVRDGGTF
jgi:DNA repair exonuclease SbcCD ATPase subunit